MALDPPHGMLPRDNPVLGTFQHAPSTANARSKYFSAHVVSRAELDRLKALRQNPYTGQFHSGPNLFAPMHGLQRLYRLRDNKGASDSLAPADERDEDASGSAGSATATETEDVFFLERLPDPATASSSDDDDDDNAEAAEDQEDDAFEDSSASADEVTTFGLGSCAIWPDTITPPGSVAGDAPPSPAPFRKSRLMLRVQSLDEPSAPSPSSELAGSFGSMASLADAQCGDSAQGQTSARSCARATPSPHRRRSRRRSLSVDRLDFDESLAGARALHRRARAQSVETDAALPARPSRLPRAMTSAAVSDAAAAAEAEERSGNPWIVNRTREIAASYRIDLSPAGALGKGAYSVVKLCVAREQQQEQQQLAVKIVRKRLLVSRGEKEMVRREVQIHQVLRHAHIVRLQEVFEDPKRLMLVMDRADGGSLQQLLLRSGGRLPESAGARLAAQLLSAVAYLHRLGVLQGDLKPSNVLLTRGMQVKLCDFGLSRKVPDVKFFAKTGDVHKVPFTELTGTMGYVAPELLRKEHYTVAVDMWAAGIMLFEVLGGVRPFVPYRDCLVRDVEFPAAAFKLTVSATAVDLVGKMLRRDPVERITAAAALRHEWIESRLN